MSFSIFPPILVGLTADFLFFVSLYFINHFVKVSTDFDTRITGLVGFLTLSFLLVVFFLSRWIRVKAWTFWLVFTTLFFLSALDTCLSTDILSKPKPWILTEYWKFEDKLAYCNWVDSIAFFDFIFLHALNYVVLIRAWNGLSWRSLLVFNASCMSCNFLTFAAMILTKVPEYQFGPITFAFLPATPVVIAFPFVIILSKKNFTFGKLPSPSIPVRIFDILSALVLTSSALLLTAKFLTSQGISMSTSLLPTEIIRGNDPYIFFHEEDLKKITHFPVGVIQSWIYLLIVPSFLINIYYKFQSRKLSFLWELTVVQFAFIVTTSYYYTFGALFWKTPAQFQVEKSNQMFWLINLFPVLASAMDLVSLVPYRTNAVLSTSTSAKLKSKGTVKQKPKLKSKQN